MLYPRGILIKFFDDRPISINKNKYVLTYIYCKGNILKNIACFLDGVVSVWDTPTQISRASTKVGEGVTKVRGRITKMGGGNPLNHQAIFYFIFVIKELFKLKKLEESSPTYILT